MSISYHAYLNRGYRFSVHEALTEQWTASFTGYDPARTAETLHLNYDSQYLYIPYLYELYRLRLSDGLLEKEVPDGWQSDLYFNECMSVYHLLHYVREQAQISGIWVPFESLEGHGYRQQAPDPLLVPFSRKFTGKIRALDAACQRLGGTRLSRGDVPYQFEIFPQISMQMIFWDADEDFPAQTQILVDKNITDFVHTETIGCMISDLLEKLENILL